MQGWNVLRPGPWRSVALLLGSGLVLQSGSRPTAAQSSEPSFDARWHDGRAELDGYTYTITRYGHPRRGQAVMIYVTEPWSLSKRVKVEDAAKNPSDVFDVLKLNLVRDFQTGIYDYNTMLSLFVKTTDFSPVQITFTSAEWCGNVYAKLQFENETVNETLYSYFEDESGTRALERPADGLSEDALFILMRGLRGEFLAPGAHRTVPLLSGMLDARLRHRPLEWASADIARNAEPVSVRVPAGSWSNAVHFTVTLPNGRTGEFWVEPDRDHRILKWTWMHPDPGEASESGELSGTLRTAYWKENGPGKEALLKQLGLRPSVP